MQGVADAVGSVMCCGGPSRLPNASPTHGAEVTGRGRERKNEGVGFLSNRVRRRAEGVMEAVGVAFQ